MSLSSNKVLSHYLTLGILVDRILVSALQTLMNISSVISSGKLKYSISTKTNIEEFSSGHIEIKVSKHPLDFHIS